MLMPTCNQWHQKRTNCVNGIILKKRCRGFHPLVYTGDYSSPFSIPHLPPLRPISQHKNSECSGILIEASVQPGNSASYFKYHRLPTTSYEILDAWNKQILIETTLFNTWSIFLKRLNWKRPSHLIPPPRNAAGSRLYSAAYFLEWPSSIKNERTSWMLISCFDV